jgi:hypothetical protein
MFKVRIYFGDTDYLGKIVDVKMISFTDNNSGIITTSTGELLSNIRTLVILEPISLLYNPFSKRLEMVSA